MANYITEQVQETFSSKKEWESFLLLVQNKDNIQNDWLQTLRSKVNEMVINSLPDEWGFVSLGLDDWRWFIKEYDTESLCLLQEGINFSLWADECFLKPKKTYNLLQESKYSLIKSAFDRIDVIYGSNDAYRFTETGNYLFEGELSNGNLNIDKFAWYANYKTEELANQIITKVNKFIKNPEITEMFREINELSKK